MFQLIKQHKYFFILTLLYIVGGIFILEFTPKGAIEILINSYHHPIFDFFFKSVTNLGDGLFSILVLILLLCRKIYYGITAGICFLVTTLITQGMKRYVFEDALRPSKFLTEIKNLYYIEGLEIHSYFSFPSGHSSGAFTLFLFLALITKKKYTDFIFFFLALLVTISRMYLLQHFFEDTYCGALIGISVTFTIFYFIHFHTNWRENKNLEKPLFKVR